jgi:hypothetical protein
LEAYHHTYVAGTLRSHFTEVAETYANVRPWKHRHSLWWWLGHVHSFTIKLADDRHLCPLKELVRDLHYHQPALIDFVEQHQVRDACVRA